MEIKVNAFITSVLDRGNLDTLTGVSQGKSPIFILDRWLGRPQKKSHSGRGGEEKNSYSYQ
jgi:hypothetical protein